MKVKMLKDEIIQTGPVRLYANRIYDLPSGMAQHLIERKLATAVDVFPVTNQPYNLEGLTVAELKFKAKNLGIIGYSGMSKAKLKQAIKGKVN